MASDHPLTYEELIDNYEFKVARRILIREYPWIKDVFIRNPDDVNKYNLIFIDIMFNPFELGEEKGWRIPGYIIRTVGYSNDFWSPYLSTYYTGEGRDDVRDLVTSIEKMLEDLHKSAAIPQEMRLPGSRKLNIGSWYTEPGTQVPTDYVDWANELE